MDELNFTKTSTDPFFFSDMFGHKASNMTKHIINDSSETIFSLTRGIDFTKLGNQSVLPYLNGTQLIKDLMLLFLKDGVLVQEQKLIKH